MAIKRIAICGSHGTGKTTLAKYISKALRFPLIEEAARVVIPTYGFKTTDEFFKAAEKEKSIADILQVSIFYKQLENEKSNIFFVSDRSVLDNIAYAQYLGVNKDILKSLTDIAYRHVKDGYDLLVYIYPTIPIEDDGFRLADQESRQKIADILEQHIKKAEKMGVNVLYIDETEFRLRVEKIMYYIVAKGD